MRDNYADEIIDFIREKGLLSGEVADALNKTGVLDNISALNPGTVAVGPAYYTAAYEESNWPLHEGVTDAPEGSVVFIDAIECGNRAVLGEIVCDYLFSVKKIGGLVINGLARDVAELRTKNYPIWIRGVTPLGCVNRKIEPRPSTAAAITERRDSFTRGVLVCDDTGCTLIGKEKLTSATLKKFTIMEFQEAVWKYCVHSLRWSTYDTVCLKKYLTEQDAFPDWMKKRLHELEGSPFAQ